MDAGGTTYYYHANGQFSTEALTNSAGAAVELYSYAAYGSPIILAPDGVTQRAVSAIGNSLFFTGRRLDAETGLFYYRARYFDVSLGRFLSRDPIGFKGGDLNLYAYVRAMTTGAVDPLGTCCWKQTGRIEWDTYKYCFTSFSPHFSGGWPHLTQRYCFSYYLLSNVQATIPLNVATARCNRPTGPMTANGNYPSGPLTGAHTGGKVLRPQRRLRHRPHRCRHRRHDQLGERGRHPSSWFSRRAALQATRPRIW
jgi:RHS repeat-associated protein